MGLTHLISSSSFENGNNLDINPNPNVFEIINHKQIGNFLLVTIRYPNCTNFEGKKIMVYSNCDIYDLLNQKVIDPHFSNNKKFHSPIARFEPTEEGYRMAELFLQFYSSF